MGEATPQGWHGLPEDDGDDLDDAAFEEAIRRQRDIHFSELKALDAA